MTAPTAVPADRAVAPDPDLNAARKAAGIADRPSTDAAPATGGLPDVRVECLGGARAVSLAQLRGPTLVNGWTYPHLYDADLVFRTRLQVTGLPLTFFVRADGTVAGRHAGPFTSSAPLADEAREHLGVTP